MFHLRFAALLFVLALAGRAWPQGQVLTVDDGPNDYGAVWIFDLDSGGALDSLSLAPLPEPISDLDAYGAALAPLGDLDGNGTPDLAVGAPGDDRAGVDRGAVWILFRDSNASLTSRVALRPGRNLFGPPEGARSFASALAPLGDLDGDGTFELAVNHRSTGSAPPPGSLWILSLRSDGSAARELEIREGAGGFGGDLTFGAFGGGLAGLGDFDGNGVADLAVGEPASESGAIRPGAVWILLLNSDGTVESAQKIGDASGGFGGALSNGDGFGASVASLGDLDGDGVTDLAVGAPGSDDSAPFQEGTGALWILLLNSDGTVKAEQRIGEGWGGFASALDALDRYGTSAVALGDVDGDGITDVGVGATGDDDAGTDAGAIWVLTMNADGTVQSEQRLAGAFTGLAGGDSLGAELVGVGDWDGDARPDFCVGASQRDGPPTFPDFSAIHTAVNAAASGDTILIRGGTYGSFAVEAKSATIQAANPLNVRVRGMVWVTDLAAAQSARLGGLVIEPRGGFGLSGVRFQNNDGRIWIDDCMVPSTLDENYGPGLIVDDCRAVILNRTRITGMWCSGEFPSDCTQYSVEPPAIQLSGASSVHAYDCVFTGTAGSCYITETQFYCTASGAGAVSTSAGDFLFLSGCTLQGGSSFGEPGGTGLQMAGTAKVLDTLLLGGQGSPPGVPTAGTGPIEFLSGESLSMAVDNPTRSGEPTLFAFEGPPGAAVYVLSALTSGARYRPALQGTDLLGAQRSLDFLGRTDADGRLQVVRALGTIPDDQVFRFFAQSFCVLQSAPGAHQALTPQLGTGAMVVRLGQSF